MFSSGLETPAHDAESGSIQQQHGLDGQLGAWRPGLNERRDSDLKPEREAQMRGFSRLFAVAAISLVCAAPAAGAGMSGGGGPNSGGSGPVLPQPDGGAAGPPGPSGPNHAPGGVLPPNRNGPNAGFKPPNQGGPDSGFKPPHHTVAPNDGGHDGDNWRRRPRRYWLGGGPIFVPDPSGDYVYSADDYDDGSDPTGCWVYRKAYNSAGAFLGWVHVDLCQGQ